MTLSAKASVTIEATPREVLEQVLNLDEYKKIDRKFARVSSVEGPDENGAGSVRLWGRMKGMPPAPDRQNFQLTKWLHLEFVGAPRQPARLVFDFLGTFDCELEAGGLTKATHAYEFRFKGPFRILEAPLRSWLQDEIEAEVQRLKQSLAN